MTVTSPAVFLQNGSYSASPIRRAFASIMRPGIVGSADLQVQPNGVNNMTVNIGTGAAWIPGTELAATQGYYFFENISAVVNKSVAASDPTNGRRDLVVARIKDQEFSGLLNTADFEVITGTPAASPADPTVPANCLVLARLTVAAGVTIINAGAITDLRTTYTGQARTTALGGILVCTTTTLPTTNLYNGLTVWTTDAKALYVYNGSTWDLVTSYAAPWSTATLVNSWANFGSGNQDAQYRKIGDIVYVRGMVKNGTTTAGTTIYNLPVGYRPLTQQVFPTIDGNNAIGRFDVTTAGNLIIQVGANNAFLINGSFSTS